MVRKYLGKYTNHCKIDSIIITTYTKYKGIYVCVLRTEHACIL